MLLSDAEITKRAAEGIMGWEWDKRMRIWRVEEDGESCMASHDDWSPLTNDRAAGEIRDVVAKKYCFQLDSVGHTPNIWRCMIGWGDDPVSVTHESPLAARSTTIAALLAFELITEADLS